MSRKQSSGHEREGDGEGRAFAFEAAYAYPAVVRLDYVPCDVKAEPRALAVARGLALVVLVEQHRQLVLRYAHARVGHFQVYMAVRMVDAEGDTAPLGREPYRV